MEATLKRKSSILKPAKTRNPLSDLSTQESTEEDLNTKPKSRRVSFASNNSIKPFKTDAEKNTIWDSTYEEEVTPEPHRSAMLSGILVSNTLSAATLVTLPSDQEMKCEVAINCKETAMISTQTIVQSKLLANTNPCELNALQIYQKNNKLNDFKIDVGIEYRHPNVKRETSIDANHTVFDCSMDISDEINDGNKKTVIGQREEKPFLKITNSVSDMVSVVAKMKQYLHTVDKNPILKYHDSQTVSSKLDMSVPIVNKENQPLNVSTAIGNKYYQLNKNPTPCEVDKENYCAGIPPQVKYPQKNANNSGSLYSVPNLNNISQKRKERPHESLVAETSYNDVVDSRNITSTHLDISQCNIDLIGRPTHPSSLQIIPIKNIRENKTIHFNSSNKDHDMDLTEVIPHDATISTELLDNHIQMRNINISHTEEERSGRTMHFDSSTKDGNMELTQAISKSVLMPVIDSTELGEHKNRKIICFQAMDDRNKEFTKISTQSVKKLPKNVDAESMERCSSTMHFNLNKEQSNLKIIEVIPDKSLILTSSSRDISTSKNKNMIHSTVNVDKIEVANAVSKSILKPSSFIEESPTSRSSRKIVCESPFEGDDKDITDTIFHQIFVPESNIKNVHTIGNRNIYSTSPEDATNTKFTNKIQKPCLHLSGCFEILQHFEPSREYSKKERAQGISSPSFISASEFNDLDEISHRQTRDNNTMVDDDNMKLKNLITPQLKQFSHPFEIKRNERTTHFEPSSDEGQMELTQALLHPSLTSTIQSTQADEFRKTELIHFSAFDDIKHTNVCRAPLPHSSSARENLSVETNRGRMHFESVREDGRMELTRTISNSSKILPTASTALHQIMQRNIIHFKDDDDDNVELMSAIMPQSQQSSDSIRTKPAEQNRKTMHFEPRSKDEDMELPEIIPHPSLISKIKSTEADKIIKQETIHFNASDDAVNMELTNVITPPLQQLSHPFEIKRSQRNEGTRQMDLTEAISHPFLTSTIKSTKVDKIKEIETAHFIPSDDARNMKLAKVIQTPLLHSLSVNEVQPVEKKRRTIHFEPSSEDGKMELTEVIPHPSLISSSESTDLDQMMLRPTIHYNAPDDEVNMELTKVVTPQIQQPSNSVGNKLVERNRRTQYFEPSSEEGEMEITDVIPHPSLISACIEVNKIGNREAIHFSTSDVRAHMEPTNVIRAPLVNFSSANEIQPVEKKRRTIYFEPSSEDGRMELTEVIPHPSLISSCASNDLDQLMRRQTIHYNASDDEVNMELTKVMTPHLQKPLSHLGIKSANWNQETIHFEPSSEDGDMEFTEVIPQPSLISATKSTEVDKIRNYKTAHFSACDDGVNMEPIDVIPAPLFNFSGANEIQPAENKRRTIHFEPSNEDCKMELTEVIPHPSLISSSESLDESKIRHGKIIQLGTTDDRANIENATPHSLVIRAVDSTDVDKIEHLKTIHISASDDGLNLTKAIKQPIQHSSGSVEEKPLERMSKTMHFEDGMMEFTDVIPHPSLINVTESSDSDKLTYRKPIHLNTSKERDNMKQSTVVSLPSENVSVLINDGLTGARSSKSVSEKSNMQITTPLTTPLPSKAITENADLLRNQRRIYSNAFSGYDQELDNGNNSSYSKSTRWQIEKAVLNEFSNEQNMMGSKEGIFSYPNLHDTDQEITGIVPIADHEEVCDNITRVNKTDELYKENVADSCRAFRAENFNLLGNSSKHSSRCNISLDTETFSRIPAVSTPLIPRNEITAGSFHLNTDVEFTEILPIKSNYRLQSLNAECDVSMSKVTPSRDKSQMANCLVGKLNNYTERLHDRIDTTYLRSTNAMLHEDLTNKLGEIYHKSPSRFSASSFETTEALINAQVALTASLQKVFPSDSQIQISRVQTFTNLASMESSLNLSCRKTLHSIYDSRKTELVQHSQTEELFANSSIECHRSVRSSSKRKQSSSARVELIANPIVLRENEVCVARTSTFPATTHNQQMFVGLAQCEDHQDNRISTNICETINIKRLCTSTIQNRTANNARLTKCHQRIQNDVCDSAGIEMSRNDDEQMNSPSIIIISSSDLTPNKQERFNETSSKTADESRLLEHTTIDLISDESVSYNLMNVISMAAENIERTINSSPTTRSDSLALFDECKRKELNASQNEASGQFSPRPKIPQANCSSSEALSAIDTTNYFHTSNILKPEQRKQNFSENLGSLELDAPVELIENNTSDIKPMNNSEQTQSVITELPKNKFLVQVMDKSTNKVTDLKHDEMLVVPSICEEKRPFSPNRSLSENIDKHRTETRKAIRATLACDNAIRRDPIVQNKRQRKTWVCTDAEEPTAIVPRNSTKELLLEKQQSSSCLWKCRLGEHLWIFDFLDRRFEILVSLNPEDEREASERSVLNIKFILKLKRYDESNPIWKFIHHLISKKIPTYLGFVKFHHKTTQNILDLLEYISSEVVEYLSIKHDLEQMLAYGVTFNVTNWILSFYIASTELRVAMKVGVKLSDYENLSRKSVYIKTYTTCNRESDIFELADKIMNGRPHALLQFVRNVYSYITQLDKLQVNLHNVRS